ncbi:MAG: Gfo/Idh/MocA family oxidoreductase [Alistipes sp.]|nr:Gfo/Idh/MocA family oxidoreductase [Alistipes sp.]MBO5856420.1 Gfo/Idh/MocA family oxidoreductase [Alistipes sp.]
MKRVITYGTYDLLHEGHINLLRRAKALGDYLIVGVTNDSFDRERGKLNVRNNVLERVEAVKATGFVDQVIIEDYMGQKIDDILKYDVDIFAIGSDWEGKFDYLKEYCEVVYLPRTEGVSSTMLRAESETIVNIGVVGCGRIAQRFIPETTKVDAVRLAAVYDTSRKAAEAIVEDESLICESFEELVERVDAVYIATPHLAHYDQTKYALMHNRHVLCETPLVLRGDQAQELYELAREKSLVLLEANKTAYCPAFNHLITLIKSGLIGDVVGIDASESKLWGDENLKRELNPNEAGGSLYEMGSYPLLPILKLLGTNHEDINIYSRRNGNGVDVYTRGIVRYHNAIASFQLGLGVKTEGNLIISGTQGYAYVPSPWWKTDYFELRYEDQNRNKKYFYKWDEPGLRYEIQEFVSCIINRRYTSARLTPRESIAMARIMEQYTNKINYFDI